MHTRQIAYLQLAGAMVTVGTTVIASKVIGEGLDPFVATAVRFAVALPIFAILMRITNTAFPRVNWRDAALLVGQAATGSVGYTILLIAGLKFTTAADAGIIVGTLPAAAALTSVILLGERLSGRTVAAVALATVGVLVVLWSSSSSPAGKGSAIGDALVFGAVLCECVFILLNKRLSVQWPALALSTVMTGLGLLIASVPAAFSAFSHLQGVSLSALLAVIYYAVIPTVVGFWLWYSGSARVAGGEAAVFTSVAPITGVLLAWLFMGDTLTPARIAGLASVVVAVLIISFRPRSIA